MERSLAALYGNRGDHAMERLKYLIMATQDYVMFQYYVLRYGVYSWRTPFIRFRWTRDARL